MSATAPDFIRRGLTYRRLDVWTDRGYLRPAGDTHPGNGRVRQFPHSELRIAELMIRLTDEGVTVEAAAAIARNPGDGAEKLRRLADLVAGGMS